MTIKSRIVLASNDRDGTIVERLDENFSNLWEEIQRLNTGEYEDTFWDDMNFPLIGQRLTISAGRLDFDYFNQGAGFSATARYPEEPISLGSGQTRHRMKLNCTIKPHIHWLQQHATEIPNILLAYKVKHNGEAGTIETDFSNHTFLKLNAHVFTYVSGVLEQISTFPDIVLTGMNVSDFVAFTLFRDSADESEIFGGADPSSKTEIITDFDYHYEIDKPGSADEYVK